MRPFQSSILSWGVVAVGDLFRLFFDLLHERRHWTVDVCDIISVNISGLKVHVSDIFRSLFFILHSVMQHHYKYLSKTLHIQYVF